MHTEALIPTLIAAMLVSLPLYYIFRWAYRRDMNLRKFRGQVSRRYNIIPFVYKYQLIDWCIQNLGGDRYSYSKMPKKALITIYRKELNEKKTREISISRKRKIPFGHNEKNGDYMEPKSNGSLTLS